MYAWSAFGSYMGAPIRQEPQLHPAATPQVALKETCRVSTARHIPLWRYHAARLRAGGCGADVISKAHEVARGAIAAYDGSLTSRVRLTLVIGTDGVPSADVERRLSSLDVMDGVVAVPIVAEADPTLPAGAAKPADRSFWDAAHREARAQGADQAIITRPNGFIIDGSTASIFCRLGMVIATPTSPAAIAGVARRWILDNCSTLGYSALAAPISVDDLSIADEVFFANAFGGIREMRGRGGEACLALSEAMRDVWEVRGRRR